MLPHFARRRRPILGVVFFSQVPKNLNDKQRFAVVPFMPYHTPCVYCVLVGCCSRGARIGICFEEAQQQEPNAGPSPAQRSMQKMTIAWRTANTKADTATSKVSPYTAPSVPLTAESRGARGGGMGGGRGRGGEIA